MQGGLNQEKDLQGGCDEIASILQMVENDDGHAYAYVYRGNHAGIARDIYSNQSYAMVQNEGETAVQVVDYYLSAARVEADPKKDSFLVSQGFVRIGTIANHYNDVFGFTRRVEQEERDFRFDPRRYISEKRARQKEKAWQMEKAKPELLQTKQALLSKLHLQKADAENTYNNFVRVAYQ